MVSTLKKEKSKVYFIKNVDTKVSTYEVKIKLREAGIDTLNIERISNKISSRPTRTIKFSVAKADEEKLIHLELRIGEHKCIIEKQKFNSVVRCYECQLFGHISKNCQGEARCVVCAGHHKSSFDCNNPKKCRNCEGLHSSSDPICPVYKDRYEAVAKQHPEYKHVEDIDECCNSKTSS